MGMKMFILLKQVWGGGGVENSIENCLLVNQFRYR